MLPHSNKNYSKKSGNNKKSHNSFDLYKLELVRPCA